MDVVKINIICFFATYNHAIKFSTASELEDARIPTLLKLLATMKSIYSVWGFRITAVVVDNVFTPMKQYTIFIKLQMALNVHQKINMNHTLNVSIGPLKNDAACVLQPCCLKNPTSHGD